MCSRRISTRHKPPIRMRKSHPRPRQSNISRARLRSRLLNRRPLPIDNRLQHTLFLLTFRRESRHLFTLDDRPTRLGINNIGKNSAAMTDGRNDTLISIHPCRNALQPFRIRVINQRRMPRRREEQPIRPTIDIPRPQQTIQLSAEFAAMIFPDAAVVVIQPLFLLREPVGLVRARFGDEIDGEAGVAEDARMGWRASVMKRPVSWPEGYKGAWTDVMAMIALRSGAIFVLGWRVRCSFDNATEVLRGMCQAMTFPLLYYLYQV